MKKNLSLSLCALFLLAAACSSKTVSEPLAQEQKQDAQYDKDVETKLSAVFKKCVASPDLERVMYNQDSFSFLISPEGTSIDSLSYRSRNDISHHWFACIEKNMKETQFSAPPEKAPYFYRADVPWAVMAEANSKLLTPIVRIRRKLVENYPQLQTCYTNFTQHGGRPSPEVLFQFDVFSDGSAKNIHTKPDTLDETLTGCIDNVISHIAFPGHEEKTVLVVDYPFVFRSY